MDSQINKKREYFPTTVAFVLIWVKRFPAMCSPVPNDLIFRGCYGFYLFFWLFCKIHVIKYFVRSELIKYSSCCRYLSPMLFNIYHICWINNNLLSGRVHFSKFSHDCCISFDLSDVISCHVRTSFQTMSLSRAAGVLDFLCFTEYFVKYTS